MSLKSVVLVAALFVGGAAATAETVMLTALERSQGWKLLFDGKDVSDWRGYRANKVPTNWTVVGGSLVGAPGVGLVSVAEFQEFELLFDWKVAEGGHGEVYFHVSEDAVAPEEIGLMVELAGHRAALAGNGLGPPDRTIPPQFDVWYRTKIVVYGKLVEYWINGERIHSYVLDSPSWRQAVAASRFAGFRDYGVLQKGNFVLVGDGVQFRNIKVRAI
ncbi:MAG: DUF1080 domain-containing protein [Candidatus Didemnitutus sp.]|nr:DUF1080 domain-containing protein [Candidatus Didemnitutus sp.]